MTRSPALALILALLAAPATARTETRCGWYTNPTPGNVYLTDADGVWWIAAQGTPPAPGFDDAYTTRFDDRDRIITNGTSYGHSCACATGDFGPLGSTQVHEISNLDPLPLAHCAEAPNLPDSPDPRQ